MIQIWFIVICTTGLLHEMQLQSIQPTQNTQIKTQHKQKYISVVYLHQQFKQHLKKKVNYFGRWYWWHENHHQGNSTLTMCEHFYTYHIVFCIVNSFLYNLYKNICFIIILMEKSSLYSSLSWCVLELIFSELLTLFCYWILQVWDWSYAWETEEAGERPEHQRAGAEGAGAPSEDVGAQTHRTVQQPGEFLLISSSPSPCGRSSTFTSVFQYRWRVTQFSWYSSGRLKEINNMKTKSVESQMNGKAHYD